MHLRPGAPRSVRPALAMGARGCPSHGVRLWSALPLLRASLVLLVVLLRPRAEASSLPSRAGDWGWDWSLRTGRGQGHGRGRGQGAHQGPGQGGAQLELLALGQRRAQRGVLEEAQGSAQPGSPEEGHRRQAAQEGRVQRQAQGGWQDVPQVAVLENVFVNHKGQVFNATHRLPFGPWASASAEPLQSPYGAGKRVLEVAEVVNLALGLSRARHSLLELAQRLPLFLQLCPLMPRLRHAHFLLGNQTALHAALAHLLGLPHWEHVLQPLESDEFVILAKVLYQPIHVPCPDCKRLWAALRNTFLLPQGGLPIFNASWECRASWSDVQRSAHATPPLPAPPLPRDWVVLVAAPPLALPVDPSGGLRPAWPHNTLLQLVRSSFWMDRVSSFSENADKEAAQALVKRAGLLVSAPGFALELLPFMTRGAVVLLLEPRFETPSDSAREERRLGDSELGGNDSAEHVMQSVRALAHACELQLLSVVCTLQPSLNGPGSSPEGLLCGQDELAQGVAAAEDALCRSGLLGPSAACSVPEGIPGTGLWTAWEVEELERWASCTAKEGKWVFDPIPRRLAWTSGDPDRCDVGRMHGEEADAVAALVPGVLAGEAVDGRTGDQALQALEDRWDVRRSAKYRWAVDGGACPAPGPAPQGAAGEGLVVSKDGAYGRHWQPFTPREFCSALGGGRKHIVILGDSMMSLMTLAFVRNLMRDEKYGPQRKAAVMWQSPKGCKEFFDEHKDAVNTMSCDRAVFNNCPGLQVTHLRNYRLRPVTESIPSKSAGNFMPFATVFRHVLDDADVILMNRGAHFAPTPRFTVELRSVARMLRAWYPQKLIVFRNTPPGHINCTSYDRPLESPQDPRLYPQAYHWQDFKEQNEVARGIMRQFGILYLDVYAMTILRADGHNGLSKNNSTDCLHYCSPGVVDYWIELLFNTIRHVRMPSM